MTNRRIVTAILIAAVAVVVWLWLDMPHGPSSVIDCADQLQRPCRSP